MEFHRLVDMVYLVRLATDIASRDNPPKTSVALKQAVVDYKRDFPHAKTSPSRIIFNLRAFEFVYNGKRNSVRFNRKALGLSRAKSSTSKAKVKVKPPVNPSKLTPAVAPEAKLPVVASDHRDVADLAVRKQVSNITPATLSLLNKDSRKKLEKNKNNMVVTSIQQNLESKLGVSSGEPVIIQKGTTIEIPVRISGPRKNAIPLAVDPYVVQPVTGLSIHRLSNASDNEYVCTIHALHQGSIRGIIAFDFRDFLICRYIEATVGDPATEQDVKILQPIEPYEKKKPKRKANYKDIVPGVRPLRPVTKFQHPLKPYLVPKETKQKMSEGFFNDRAAIVINEDNHTVAFQTLLQLEEMKMDVDIRLYDRRSQLKRQGELYLLNVPGLAEKRPSVLYGDKVYVSPTYRESSKEYEGYVHMVLENEVGLKFNSVFTNEQIWIKDGEFDIRFSFTRTPLRIMHRAMELSKAKIPKQILYPKSEHLNESNVKVEDHLTKPERKALNEEQLKAVGDIVSKHHSSVPYIIFGPPGTGKTHTLVNAIIGVSRAYPKSRMLVCTPSNSAADQIVERLEGSFMKTDMLRLNAYKRDRRSVSKTVEKYSRLNPATGGFDIPALAEILTHRIVVVTCISAAMLYSIGVPAGHFSHFFIDEAGQATEPEILSCIAGLISEDGRGQLVLAGDPKQLGPVIRSGTAKRFGYSTSYLERLISQPIYANEDSYDKGTATRIRYKHPNIIIKLVRNYRNHPRIMELSSKLFYDNEIVPCADIVRRQNLCRWSELPPMGLKGTDEEEGFPLIFHGVNGKDMREGNSPSWFNPDEAAVVKKYITRLREERNAKVKFEDIGVIAPYRKQVQKIRRLFTNEPQLKIGSVEEFQGQERRVIIVSTVRSSSSFIDHDLAHNLGFVKNSRRFNVAVTRAQSLIIVIGNPQVLRKDPSWKKFIHFVKRHGGYRGWDVPATTLSGMDSDSEDTEDSSDGENDAIESLVNAVQLMDMDESSNGSDDDTDDDPEWTMVDI